MRVRCSALATPVIEATVFPMVLPAYPETI